MREHNAGFALLKERPCGVTLAADVRLAGRDARSLLRARSVGGQFRVETGG